MVGSVGGREKGGSSVKGRGGQLPTSVLPSCLYLMRVGEGGLGHKKKARGGGGRCTAGCKQPPGKLGGKIRKRGRGGGGSLFGPQRTSQGIVIELEKKKINDLMKIMFPKKLHETKGTVSPRKCQNKERPRTGGDNKKDSVKKFSGRFVGKCPGVGGRCRDLTEGESLRPRVVRASRKNSKKGERPGAINGN